MIVGEDPIKQNEQGGVFLCECVTKPGRQEEGIILRHERLGVGVRQGWLRGIPNSSDEFELGPNEDTELSEIESEVLSEIESEAAIKSSVKSSVGVDERKFAAQPSTTGVVIELTDKEKRAMNKKIKEEVLQKNPQFKAVLSVPYAFVWSIGKNSFRK